MILKWRLRSTISVVARSAGAWMLPSANFQKSGTFRNLINEKWKLKQTDKQTNYQSLNENVSFAMSVATRGSCLLLIKTFCDLSEKKFCCGFRCILLSWLCHWMWNVGWIGGTDSICLPLILVLKPGYASECGALLHFWQRKKVLSKVYEWHFVRDWHNAAGGLFQSKGGLLLKKSVGKQEIVDRTQRSTQEVDLRGTRVARIFNSMCAKIGIS